jgi:N-ethylmaleimide reductase
VNTIPNDIMAEYYEQRATAGLIITEGTQISIEGTGWLNAPHLHKEVHCEGWKPVVARVHEASGVIYCQLWHLGRQSHSSFHPDTNRIVSASNIPMPPGQYQVKTTAGEAVDNEIPHSLTIDEIQQTIRDFVHSAKLAQAAGFDGIELHGANGYLIDQFFQSCSNQRTDEYGIGSVENRCRLLVEIFQAIVASGAFPAHRIGFRMSPNGTFGGMGSADNDSTFIEIAKIMNELQPAYLHLMDGTGFGFHGLCKALTATDFRKVFDHPIICNVGLTKEIAEGMIRSGACDLACFGRLYISNPDLPERFANDYPLNELAPYDTWWRPTGAQGYTDWPVYSGAEEIATTISL